MRILFVLPSVPFPPTDGGKAKIYNLLKYLASRHQCDLLCLGEAGDDVQVEFRKEVPALGAITVLQYPSRLRQIAKLCWHLVHLRPSSFARYTNSRLAHMLADIIRLGQYDILHFDIINMAQYLNSDCQTITVHSPNDATSQVYSRLATVASTWLARIKLRFSSRLFRRFEREVYPRFSKIHVVSEEDKFYLLNIAPKSDIEVIPISSGYPYALGTVKHSYRRLKEGPVIAICGNLGDAAIALGFKEFLDNLLPKLCDVYPTLRVRVLGRWPPNDLLRKIRTYPSVEYLSQVSDFESFLTEADVVLTPDKAGAPGAKTRVVQAMALGRVVLGSEAAFEGVLIRDGVHGMIYRNILECYEKLVDLLENEELRQTIGQAAAIMAAEEFALERIGPRYEALYISALNRVKTSNAIKDCLDCATERPA